MLLCCSIPVFGMQPYVKYTTPSFLACTIIDLVMSVEANGLAVRTIVANIHLEVYLYKQNPFLFITSNN